MSTPAITAKALRLLARQIQSPDEIPAMCLSDAADLIEKMAGELAALNWGAIITHCPTCRHVFEVTSVSKPTNPKDQGADK